LEAFVATGAGGKLLSQGKILDYKRVAGFQQGSKQPDDQFEKKRDHGPNLARREMANNSAPHGFPRITPLRVADWHLAIASCWAT